MASLAMAAIPITTACFLAFSLFYGAQAITTFHPPGCSLILIDCVQSVVAIAGGIANFALFGLLGGTPLNPVFSIVLFLVADIPWILIITGVFRGAQVG